MTAASLHKIAVSPLSAAAFAPYGQIVTPRRAGGQGVGATDHARDPEEAKLVLDHGEPRLWIMRLVGIGTRFRRIARHRRVTQCLGALGGKDWLIGVAPPNDLSDAGRPRLDDIVGFRVPGDCVIKLHVATWHAGPHFTHDAVDFVNLEMMDTNQADFHAVDLGVDCAFEL
ncbi:MAG TPA: ureidoglycolate lyase [Candidatus Sulfotelmatobacter sp.]|nr:ureidoglycolate lyase [Candidatus Sulfotelmatobacter sp.]